MQAEGVSFETVVYFNENSYLVFLFWFTHTHVVANVVIKCCILVKINCLTTNYVDRHSTLSQHQFDGG
jgi:hypothetical protein